MGVLKASEAVSGRNILILPIYASVLRPSRGLGADGCKCLARAHGRHGLRLPIYLRSGYVMALALFSAKSAGTENFPVFRS